MTEDARVQEARAYLASPSGTHRDEEAELIGNLLRYADERLRVNVGLITENSALRAKARQPESLDLSQVPLRALLDELEARAGSRDG